MKRYRLVYGRMEEDPKGDYVLFSEASSEAFSNFIKERNMQTEIEELKNQVEKITDCLKKGVKDCDYCDHTMCTECSCKDNWRFMG